MLIVWAGDFSVLMKMLDTMWRNFTASLSL